MTPAVAARQAAARTRPVEGLSDIAARVIPLAIWFGVVTGLGEATLIGLKKFALHRVVRVSPDVVWMAPLADIVLFSLVGLLLIGLAKLWPRAARIDVATGVFASLCFFTLALHYTPVHMAAKAVLAAGLGVQAGRLARAHPDRFGRLLGRTLGWSGWREWRGATAAGRAFPVRGRHIVVGAAVVLACLAGTVQALAWTGERSALAGLPAARDGRSILLIVWDTVRASSLSLYGYERPTTPHLDAFASDALVFERALSTSPWTLPTHASLFTGRWHHELSSDWESALDDTHPTLGEFLAGRGYLTAGFVANTFFGSFEHGLDRGFARYEDYRVSPGQILVSSALGNTLACGSRSGPGCRLRGPIGYYDLPGRKTAEHVNESFLDWLADRDDYGRPFFAFLNYFDAHAPYVPPEPFASRFGSDRRGNPMQLEYIGWVWTDEQAKREQAAYDGAIAYLDDQLARLLEALEQRGVLDETIVVLVSDHGEEFLEHGVMSHSNSLYLPSLHVPLVIRTPDAGAAGRVAAPVSVRDLPATLMDLLGIDEHPFPGRSLVRRTEASAVEPIHADLSGRSFRQEHYPVSRGDMKSVVVDPFHFILDGDGREQIFDIRRDPWETRDLGGAGLAQDVRDSLRRHLDRRQRSGNGDPIEGEGR